MFETEHAHVIGVDLNLKLDIVNPVQLLTNERLIDL